MNQSKKSQAEKILVLGLYFTVLSQTVLAKNLLEGVDASSNFGVYTSKVILNEDDKKEVNKKQGFRSVEDQKNPIDGIPTIEKVYDRCEAEAKKSGKIRAQFYSDFEGDFRFLVFKSYRVGGNQPVKLGVHSDDGVSIFIVKSSEKQVIFPKPSDLPVLARFNKGQDFTNRYQSFQVANYILQPGEYYTICVFYGNNYKINNQDVDGLSLYLIPVNLAWFTLRVDSNMDKKINVDDESIKQDKTQPMILDVNNGDCNQKKNHTPDNEEPEAKDPECVKNISTHSGKGHEFPEMNLVLKPTLLPKGYKVVISKNDIEKNPLGIMRVFAPKKDVLGTWEPIIGVEDGQADVTERIARLGNDTEFSNPPTLKMGLETYSWGVVEIKADAFDTAGKPATPDTMFTDKVIVEGNVDRYFDGKKIQALKGGDPQRPVYAGVLGLIKKPSNAGKIDAIHCHFSCIVKPVITRYQGRLRNNFNETDVNSERIAKKPDMSVWIGLQSKGITTRSSNPEGWIQGGLIITRPLAGGQTVEAFVEAGSQPVGSNVLHDKERNAAFQTFDNHIIILRNRAIRQAVMLIKTGEKWNVLQRKVGIPSGYQGEPYFEAFVEADFNTVQATCEMPFTTTNIPGSASNPVKWENIEVGYLKDEKIKEPAEGTHDASKYADWILKKDDKLKEGYNWIALDGPEPHIHVPNGKQVDAVIPPIGKGDTYHYHAEIKKETDGRVVVKAWDTRN